MKILRDKNLRTLLNTSHIFLDTSVFISASHHPEFLSTLEEMRADCAFMTIPSVVFEFTRKSNTVKGFSDRIQLSSLANTYPIEKEINEFKEFLIILNFAQGKNASFTDALLCCCLYKFRNSKVFLMTSNSKDIPLSIFNAEASIILDTDESVTCHRIYSINNDNLDKAASNILK